MAVARRGCVTDIAGSVGVPVAVVGVVVNSSLQ